MIEATAGVNLIVKRKSIDVKKTIFSRSTGQLNKMQGVYVMFEFFSSNI